MSIRVLIVEDSPVQMEILKFILSSDPALTIVVTATNGEEAIAAAQRLAPDVITMDIHMPKMSGYDATRCIMETKPAPIVIVSANYDPEDVEGTMLALDTGALAAVTKPPGPNHPQFAAMSQTLIQTVKTMSEVKVIRRWPKTSQASIMATPIRRTHSPVQIIAIGASTGGPPVLQSILAHLPVRFPVPILIVQHICQGFVQGFADWMGQTTQRPVRVAIEGDRPQPGMVYVAPDTRHMGVAGNGRIYLIDTPADTIRPSVNVLFNSLAVSHGAKAAAVLLTGMGRDGADGMKAMKDRGAVTIAQDKDSSVVFGMPGAAVELGAADYVLPPLSIAETLINLVEKH